MNYRNLFLSGGMTWWILVIMVFLSCSFPTQGKDIDEADRTNPPEIVAKKLKTPILPQYKETPFHVVLKDLARKADLKITLDPKGLAMEELSPDTPISLTTKHELMAKSVLNLILYPLNLTYDIYEDEIVVCSESQYDARIVNRQYEISDLAASPEEQKQLIEQIGQHLQRSNFEDSFQKESTAISKDRKQIIVKQNRQIQEQIRDFLNKQRKTK